MSEEHESAHIRRKLGYCVVQWEIDNFWIATCQEGRVIHSPEFYVIGEEKTKWRINLSTKFKRRGATYLSIERVESDSGPDLVRANWNFSLQDKSGNSIHEAKEYRKKFGIRFGDEYSKHIHMGYTSEVLKKLHAYEEDSLIVVCRLIVHVEELSKDFEDSSVASGSLSKDLNRMFTRISDNGVPKSTIKSDIILYVENGKIEAHSVILHARNARFRRILSTERGRIIRIGEVDYVSTEQLVSYLYSGDMNFVFRNPTILLFEVLKYFQAEDVLNYYQPDLLTLSTDLCARDERFRWTIGDFSLLKDHCITSPILRQETLDIAWELKVYPRGRARNEKHIEISARIVEGRRPLCVCLEFIMVNRDERHIYSTRLCTSVEGHEELIVDKFVERDSMSPDVLDNRNLRIIFRVRIATGVQNESSVIRTRPVFSNVTTNPFNYLSRDIERMLRDVSFTDINLVVGGTHRRYHKCILAARSQYFSDEFRRRPDVATIDMLNMGLNLFDILVSYMYSGRMERGVLLHDPILDLPLVYDTAEEFGVYNFNEDFIKFWQKNLMVQNVCVVLVFAEDYQKIELKQSALKFIKSNIQAVQSDKCWSNLSKVKQCLISKDLESFEQEGVNV